MSHVLWINLLACLYLFGAPFLPWSNVDVRWNEPLTGVAVAIAAILTMSNRVRPVVGAGVTIAAGLWLMVSALVLTYPMSRPAADVLVAGLLMTVSMIELLPGVPKALE